MKRLTLFLALSMSAFAGDWSMGFMAAETSWNSHFTDLQTPGWNTAVHPGGIVDVQYKHFFVELGGDPHRTGEATTVSGGLRGDLLHYGRYAFYGQASLGEVIAPSFLEYCWSYEYQNGDCGAGAKKPEECPWFSVNVGLGVRIKLTEYMALEPARVEYLSPYAIGPRWRFSSGFRLYLK